jgi:hypothetical protein
VSLGNFFGGSFLVELNRVAVFFLFCGCIASQDSAASRTVDLDVDIGADAVDYKSVFCSSY